MEPTQAFRLALQSLCANKVRSILTLLEVIIGVASVITVVTLSNGAKVKVNLYGASVVTISKPAYKASSLDPITALRAEL